MTAQPLAPAIPSSGVPASLQCARPAASRRLPLASPVPVPSAPDDVVYGIARIDASGRICERAVITALGWAGGDRRTFTADAEVVPSLRSGRCGGAHRWTLAPRRSGTRRAACSSRLPPARMKRNYSKRATFYPVPGLYNRESHRSREDWGNYGHEAQASPAPTRRRARAATAQAPRSHPSSHQSLSVSSTLEVTPLYFPVSIAKHG